MSTDDLRPGGDGMSALRPGDRVRVVIDDVHVAAVDGDRITIRKPWKTDYGRTGIDTSHPAVTVTRLPDAVTALDHDAVRARCDAATEGPWETPADMADVILPWEVIRARHLPQIELEDTVQGRADADFIRHARTDVPALLEENACLRAELAEARAINASLMDAIEKGHAARQHLADQAVAILNADAAPGGVR